MKHDSDNIQPNKVFWALSVAQHLAQLDSTEQGLSAQEAGERLKRYGPNRLNGQKRSGVWRLLLAQFKSSIILLLLFATGISFYLHDRTDALIILAIVLIRGLLGFWQEKGAADTPLSRRRNMCSWPPAPTSATCSAWPAPRCFCRFCRCCRSRFC